jgi:hypothetical protein
VALILILFQLLIAPGIAIAWGGRPERCLAIAYWLDTVGSLLVTLDRLGAIYQRPEWGVAAVDLVMLGYAIHVTIKANRWWPIWFTAMHLIGLIAHLARMIETSIAPIAYQVMAAYVAYPLWMMIIAGVAGHELRLRRYGSDPDWKLSLPQSIRLEHPVGRRRF